MKNYFSKNTHFEFSNRHPGLALFLCVFITHLVYSLFVHAPLIHGDEGGYLMNAAALVGYKTAAYSSYYSGYSVFLTPAFLLSCKPYLIYQYVHVINALAWSCVGVTSRSIFTRLRVLDGGLAASICAFAVASYPSFLVFSSLALSENIFVLAVVLSAWLLIRLADEGRLSHLWMLLGLTSCSVLIHPKGIALFISSVIVASTLIRGRIRHLSYWFLVVPLFALAIAAAHHLERTFMKGALEVGRVTIVGHYPTVFSTVRKIIGGVGLEFFERLAVAASGQVSYLLASSAGLFALGALWLINIFQKSKDRTLTAFASYSMLTMSLTIGISVLMMMSGDRADHVIYGRYNEGALALVLIPGFLMVPAGWKRFAAICVVGGLLLASVALSKGVALPGAIVLTNIAGLGGMVQSAGSINLAHIFAYFAVSMAIVALASRRGLIWLGIAVSVIFWTQAMLVLHLYLMPGSALRAQQHTLADYVKTNFPDIDCVNYDEQATAFWEKSNYPFYFLPVSLYAVDEPYSDLCSPLLVTARGNLADVFPSSIPLSQEAYSPETLWYVPTLDNVDRRNLGANIPWNVKISPANNADEFRDALGGGWYPPEGWGAWSSGDSYLLLRLPSEGGRPGRLRLRLKIFGASNANPKGVSISENGSVLFRATVTNDNLFIADLDLAQVATVDGKVGAGLHVLRLQTTRARSPAQLGISADARMLGAGLTEIQMLGGE